MSFEGIRCPHCDSMGIIMAPQLVKRQHGQGEYMDTRAFRCPECHAGLRYAGVRMAGPEELRHGASLVEETTQRTAAWYAGLGKSYADDTFSDLMDAARAKFREYRNESLMTNINSGKNFR